MLDGTSILTQLLASAHLRRLKREQAEKMISESGLDPIFNEQTPAIPNKTEITPDVLELCRDVLVFAHHNPYLKLAGLAANQLGKNGERLTINACFINRGYEFGWVTALNPEIIQTHGFSRSNTEGCLTWLKKQILAERHEDVTVSYLTVEGEKKEERVTGFEAIVWQHEINHLNGVPEHVVDPQIKMKPNDQCCCGSERKFKVCCGRR